MINKFKNRIKRVIRGFNKSQKEILSGSEFLKESQQIQFDYHQISKLFSENEFIPFTSWSISPSTILHILNEILLNEKKNIIEFGAGSSTLYIAKFLKLQKLDSVRFYTVESDEVWIEKITRLGKLYDLDDFFEIVYSPINEVDRELSMGEQVKWYGIEYLQKILSKGYKFDLVIVDGPWRGVSPNARYSAVPALEKHLAERVSIFLDDTYRKEEFRIAEKWREKTGLDLMHFNKYSLLTNENVYHVEPFRLNKWRYRQFQ